MKVIIVKNYDEASVEASKIMLAAIKSNPNIHLGLATGSTPVGLYKIMVQDHKDNGTSYSGIKSFNLDEYYGLESTHDQSYYYFMMEHLFNHVDVDVANVHIPPSLGDVEAGCNRYNEMLATEGVDLQLLGIGSNGHIGFNEPGTSFDAVTRVIDLEPSTVADNARLFFNGDEAAVPKQAVTQGIKNIMDAREVLLIACGENKADAVKGMIEGEITNDLPASILQKHDNVTVIIDEAAASKLKK